jgi:hypothetical protein
MTYCAVYDRLTYEGFIAGIGEDGYRANVRSTIKRIRNKFRACDPPSRRSRTTPLRILLAQAISVEKKRRVDRGTADVAALSCVHYQPSSRQCGWTRL